VRPLYAEYRISCVGENKAAADSFSARAAISVSGYRPPIAGTMSGVSTNGSCGMAAQPKRATRSVSAIGSMRSIQPHDQASKPSSAWGDTPNRRRFAR